MRKYLVLVMLIRYFCIHELKSILTAVLKIQYFLYYLKKPMKLLTEKSKGVYPIKKYMKIALNNQ